MCISSAILALGEGEEVGSTSLVGTFCLEICNEIADLIETQNALVDECTCTSPLTQLHRALGIRNLVTQCRILAQIIKCEKYFSDEPKGKKHEDLTLLRY
jgi:hypothetical protein